MIEHHHETGQAKNHDRVNRKAGRHKSERSEPIIHELKSWPEFFEETLRGAKTHDLRRSDDRDFKIGDTLRLREFDPKRQAYTGRELDVEVTYITSFDSPCALSEAALHPNFCILSIRKNNS